MTRHLALLTAALYATGAVALPRGLAVTSVGEPGGPVRSLWPNPDSTVLFESDEPLVFTIEMDWRTVVRDRNTNDQKDHPAELILAADTGAEVRLNIGVRPRGRFRRQPRICNFPPLRLDFKRKEVTSTVFENQDKLKLVTHCRNGRDEYEQYVLKEYLIYRAFNVITDTSLRVRLARITYIDTEGREDSREEWGFLIESEEELASRLGGFLIEERSAHPVDVEHSVMARVDLFQFMIGNTDWSVIANHNVKLLRTETDYIVVPYDFDWAGAVSARYAKPDERFGMRNVRQRVYRGFCGYEEAVMSAVEQFKAERDAIYALYNQLTPLSERERKRTLEYYDEFYKILDNPRSVEYDILHNCRGR